MFMNVSVDASAAGSKVVSVVMRLVLEDAPNVYVFLVTPGFISIALLCVFFSLSIIYTYVITL